jgi:VanZ family protein
LRTSLSDRRSFWFWLRAWLPVVFTIAIIAAESTEYFGADRTSGPLRFIYEHIFGPVAAAAQWEEIHHNIRKTGHFIGYGLVGLSWLRAWWLTLPESNFVQDAFFALLGTAAVASADEFHQTLLPNRTGLASDVVLDCCGAIALQLLVYLFMRLFRPKQLARAA